MKTFEIIFVTLVTLTLSLGIFVNVDRYQPWHFSPEKMQREVVMLSADESKASGIIFKRLDRHGEPRTFVWTAAHFAKHITGEVTARQDIIKGRRVCGRLESPMRLIKIVPGYDLAVLEVLNTEAFNWTATFDLTGHVPAIGSEISHVGNWMGAAGHQSYSEGIVSYPVRTVEELWGGVPMVQSSVIAFPGSSGGPVFDRHSGKVIGMVLGMSWPAVNYFLPMEVWVKVARENNLYWALDPRAPMPDFIEKKS